jgi:hypothetical protein
MGLRGDPHSQLYQKEIQAGHLPRWTACMFLSVGNNDAEAKKFKNKALNVVTSILGSFTNHNFMIRPHLYVGI